MSVNYTSFNDAGVTLPKNNGDIDEDISFNTPNVDPAAAAVLSFELFPSSGSPTVEVEINGNRVYNTTFTSNVERVVQENFNQSILATNNTLTLRVTGSGTARVRDCVVLHKTL